MVLVAVQWEIGAGRPMVGSVERSRAAAGQRSHWQRYSLVSLLDKGQVKQERAEYAAMAFWLQTTGA